MTVAADSRAAFIDALEMGDVRYSETEDGGIRIGWASAPVDFRQYVTINDVHEGMVRVNIHLVPSFSVPPELRAEVVYFLGRVNWDIAMGNWELDVEDGQVIFRESLTTDQPVSANLADYYLGISRWHASRVMPSLMRIVNDGFRADEAYLDYSADFDVDDTPTDSGD